VGSADSEVASMITEGGCGMVTPNGDASGLAEAIKQAARQGGQHVGAHAVGFENALAKWREILS
jgi:hypothetical protein